MAESLRTNSTELPSEAVIFGSTAAMRTVRSSVDSVLNSCSPVLIQGESGTGKELVAQFLHSRSNRCRGPFVKLDCSAFTRDLLARELFGYDKRLFPGASVGKRGLLELADGGTLFLAQIGDMEWTLQEQLLRQLQDGTYYRIAGLRKRRADVRIICSTKIDLGAAVNGGRFRQDLFLCIDAMCLHLPALRDRKEDIPQLWDFFARKLAKKFKKSAPELTLGALSKLQQWNWPGNLRELENGIARVIVLSDKNALSGELERPMASSKGMEIQQQSSAASEDSILKIFWANDWIRERAGDDLNQRYPSLRREQREAYVPQRCPRRIGRPQIL